MRQALVRFAATILLLALSVAVSAQPVARVYRIGFVHSLSSGTSTSLAAFREGLKEHGYVEGKNLIIEARFADGRNDRLPELLDELLRLKVEVLLAAAPAAALASKRATTSVPVVFAGVADPVGRGLVQSLARPGGNVTGIGGILTSAKLVELLKEAVPGVSRVALLSDRAEPLNAQVVAQMQEGARSLMLKLDVYDAGNAVDLDRALAAIDANGADGIVVTSAPFLFTNRARIADFAVRKRLPAVQPSRQFAEAGGLVAYGSSLEWSYRRAAAHVDRIFKGAKPADLPVEQPTHFELVINLKTARAMGLKIPQSLLLRADHVIE